MQTKNKKPKDLQCNRCKATFYHWECNKYRRVEGELISICPLCNKGTLRVIPIKKN